MSVDPLEDLMKDPDRRAKLYLLFVGVQILVTVMIVVGTLIFILRLVGII